LKIEDVLNFFILLQYMSQSVEKVPRLQWNGADPCRTAPGLLSGFPPTGSLIWTCASHATAPSFSGYPGLRPWLIRLEATSRSPTHPLDWRGQTRSWSARPRSSRNCPFEQERDQWRALVNLVDSMHDAPRGAVHETRWWWW